MGTGRPGVTVYRISGCYRVWTAWGPRIGLCSFTKRQGQVFTTPLVYRAPGRVIYHSKNLLWVGLPRNVGAFIPVVNIRINTEVRGGQRGQGSVTGLGGGWKLQKNNLRGDPCEKSYKTLFFLWTGGVAVKAGKVVQFHENKNTLCFSQKMAKE